MRILITPAELLLLQKPLLDAPGFAQVEGVDVDPVSRFKGTVRLKGGVRVPVDLTVDPSGT